MGDFEGGAPEAPSATDTSASSDGFDEGTEELEQKPQPAKYKVKVGGKSVEVTLDELTKGYSHAQAANEKFQKASEVQKAYDQAQQQLKQFSQVMDRIKANPSTLLEFGQALGVPIDELAHQYVLEQMRLSQLSPEQKKLHQTEQQLRQYQQQMQQIEEQNKSRASQELASKAATEVENDLVKFFESNKVTPTPEMLERVLSYMLASYDTPHGPMSVEQAFNRYSQYIGRLQQQAFEHAIATGQIPEELRSKFRKADVESLRQPFRSKPNSRPSQEAPTKQRAQTSTDDYFKKLEKKYGR